MKIKLFIISLLHFLIKKNFILFLKSYIRIEALRLKNHSKKSPEQKKLKIAVINTFDQAGGAANLAFTLGEMVRKNIEVVFFVKDKKSTLPWIKQIKERKKNIISELLTKEAKRKGWIEFAGFDSLSLLKEKDFLNAQIAHLHNTHGEFLSPALLSLLIEKKTVIWTLHDEAFITGHCSCTLGCEKWKTGCGNCPDLSIYPAVLADNTALVLENKKKWITNLQPIIVTPSKWLEERVKIAYPDLKKIITIPNGIDTTIFVAKDKHKTKQKLGLPTDKIIFLFVAEFATNNPFKGGEILRNIITEIKNEKVIFITVGGQHESIFTNHITFPYIKEKEMLSDLYNACDLLIYPTQADNLPLVILESMACGTPVIASKLGGIPEIIDNKADGFLVEEFKNYKQFIQVIEIYLSMSQSYKQNLTENAINKIKNHFSLNEMTTKYLDLYFNSISKDEKKIYH